MIIITKKATALSASDKTKARIISAFFELLKTKHYSRITVTELTSAVGINRATFYRYYIDIFDLFEKIESLYSDRLLQRINSFRFGESMELIGFASLFPSQEDFDTFMLLSGKNGSLYSSLRLCEKVRTVIIDKLLSYGCSVPKAELEAYVTFLVNGGAGMYLNMFINNVQPSNDIAKIIFTSLNALLGRYGMSENRDKLEREQLPEAPASIQICKNDSASAETNSSGKANLSVQKTDRSLRNALIQLMQQKPYNKITIKELTGLAEVSSSTFYLHYRDIYDLHDKIKDGFVDELFSHTPLLTAALKNNISPIIDNLIASIEKNRPYFSALNLESYDTDLFDKLMKKSYEKILEKIDGLETKYDTMLTIDFLVAGFFGLYFYNFKNNIPISTERLAEITQACGIALFDMKNAPD